MRKIVSLLLFTAALWSENIEVSLATKSNVKPLYMSRIHTDPTEWDWRYFDELRGILEFDFENSGIASVAPVDQEIEDLFDWSDVRKEFKLEKWSKKSFPYVLAIEVNMKQFILTAFDIGQGTSKKYPPIALSGRIETDRRTMHRLADALQKDLFGIEGIASLRIVYAQREKNKASEGLTWLSEIWICDSDGALPRQLTNEKGYCLSPLFLPKAGGDPEFIYVFNNEGQSKIFRSCLSKPEGQATITLRGNQALPAVSKKGTQIAFITDVAGRPDLFLQNLDSKRQMIGKARQLYSAPRATQASPTFSPDGKRIAFVSDKDGPPRIYFLDILDPRELKRPKPFLLTTKNRENTSPAWSPDGKKLAYSAKTDGVRQIWIYDFESESEQQLTTGPEIKENPAWAPDSIHLVYNTETDESSELYLINLLQPNPVQISKGPGQKRFASWETR
jgi:TolB protein